MACYILQARLTERGRPLIVDDLRAGACAKSLDQVRAVARDIGVTVNNAYVLMGEQDFLVIAEADNDAAMAKFAMAIGAQGKVETKTMRAFDEKEADELFKSKAAEKTLRSFLVPG